VTRVLALWVLFVAVLAACWWLGRRRGVGGGRLLSALALSSALLWICAGLLGWAGAWATSGTDPRRGVAVGIAVGALIGAPLGIALSERFLHKVWPRWRALAMAALGIALMLAVFLLVLTRVGGPAEQAGRSVYVAFPLLGAAAVLGWLSGERS
jgi:peptidoglycan/LPS O-acetylase OafA/YrhL